MRDLSERPKHQLDSELESLHVHFWEQLNHLSSNILAWNKEKTSEKDILTFEDNIKFLEQIALDCIDVECDILLDLFPKIKKRKWREWKTLIKSKIQNLTLAVNSSLVDSGYVVYRLLATSILTEIWDIIWYDTKVTNAIDSYGQNMSESSIYRDVVWLSYHELDGNVPIIEDFSLLEEMFLDESMKDFDVSLSDVSSLVSDLWDIYKLKWQNDISIQHIPLKWREWIIESWPVLVIYWETHNQSKLQDTYADYIRETLEYYDFLATEWFSWEVWIDSTIDLIFWSIKPFYNAWWSIKLFWVEWNEFPATKYLDIERQEVTFFTLESKLWSMKLDLQFRREDIQKRRDILHDREVKINKMHIDWKSETEINKFLDDTFPEMDKMQKEIEVLAWECDKLRGLIREMSGIVIELES